MIMMIDEVSSCDCDENGTDEWMMMGYDNDDGNNQVMIMAMS